MKCKVCQSHLTASLYQPPRGRQQVPSRAAGPPRVHNGRRAAVHPGSKQQVLPGSTAAGGQQSIQGPGQAATATPNESLLTHP